MINSNNLEEQSLSEATAFRLFNSVAATEPYTELIASNSELRNSCRICRWNRSELQILQCPCHCKGTVGFIHLQCLKRWIMHRRDNHCEICNQPFIMPDEKLDLCRMFKNFCKHCAGSIMKHALFGASLLPLAHVVLQQVLLCMENINKSPHQQSTISEIIVASCALLTSSALFFNFFEFLTIRLFLIQNILRQWWTFGNTTDFPLVELEAEIFDFF